MSAYNDCFVGDTLVLWFAGKRVSARVVWRERDYLLAELSSGAEIRVTPRDFVSGLVSSSSRQLMLSL